ncbi:Zinc metalloproteinase toh-2 precursor, putative [Brugia malayi]|uniref:Zinc metalloproteinase dpy-31 n=2 Tax=Brugia malayi TaxID=6279 RepID=NAS35_BRUMA|nr:Zinc metalloproteinase toh-2 precursor, putative [Brugia malayi]A8Q2D1.2 RecName: Full=Zinc metalloproteinase dpy-31; AltName: Full=Nematode astacin 35; AltName: Full=Procollagen C-proteinase; Flags: Precursor [Brugia malayi]ACZ64270.1 astacin metalloprotease a [Brugia malayi]CRZ25723.1 BMA-DPY-31 [Brugia malayi]VIO90954.1 Zinc metalloproteinase toh-2 precursor, putative [Brugia malayi]
MALLKPFLSRTFSSFFATITGGRNLIDSIEELITTNYWLIFVMIIVCTCSAPSNGAFFLNDPYGYPFVSLQDDSIESVSATTITTTTIISTIITTTTATQRIFQEKAKTFGQSAEEIQKVKYYLEKIQKFEAKQHPEEIRQQHTTKNSEAIKDDLQIAVEVAKFEKRQKDSITLNPEENGQYYEGDIVLDAQQAHEIYESMIQHGRRTKRKFIRSELRRWDSHKPIIYSFDGSHTIREQRVIELALEHWHNITCLNFERRDDEIQENRIVFTDVDGCASNVGRHPLGEPQFVSLAPECIRLGVIAHEVAHALGFWHEQSRPDRDNYVTVRWENIDRDSKGQFLKELPTDVDNGDVPYDYGSIMHYRSKAFGRYEDLFTLNTNIMDYQKTIGQRDQLSFNDIRLMNVIYCSDSCAQKLPCQRGGYTDPRRCGRCRCPDGFTGKLCERIMPGFGADCGGRIELTSSWKRITSPNYPRDFKEGQECSWLLVAPPGQRVQLRFYGEFEMYCKVRHSLCMDYIEIRNSTDFANTGMRYCCYGTPKSSIMSATEDMLVLFRSFYRGGKGFQAQVRALPTTVFNIRTVRSMDEFNANLNKHAVADS